MAAIERFLARKDPELAEGVGLLCNHTSFHFDSGQYLFQILSGRGSLRRLFLPEHGLFAELQDQVGLSQTNVYESLGLKCQIVSLYGDSESTLAAAASHLKDLSALVIDIQDIGVRYYTFATTMRYAFETIHEAGLDLPVYVIDHPNPCGQSVEGIPLDATFESFVGPVGLPHRHGLTIGQLARFFHQELRAHFPLHVVAFDQEDEALPFRISPSPNMPGPYTHLVYSGQCLLEGTNVSEGRGTTRPFEIFGASYMEKLHSKRPPTAPGAVLRPVRFIPTFHKDAGKICYGYQIHVTGPYHSLLHSLQLMRWIRSECNEFRWNEGPYEFRSDRPAIELLAGHRVLLSYLNGETDLAQAEAAIQAGEHEWKNRIRSLS